MMLEPGRARVADDRQAPDGSRATQPPIMSPSFSVHVGLRVADLQRSIDFYNRGLDFTVVSVADVAGIDGMTVAFLVRDGAVLELAHVPGEILAIDGPHDAAGFRHLGFRVKDPVTAATVLTGLGGTLASGVRLSAGTRSVVVRGPDGELVELVAWAACPDPLDAAD